MAWSGDRKPGADGKLPPVGNTVDVANATWTNTHRRARADRGLEGPGLRSRRSARSTTRACIEIPTPRWTAYDAKHFGVKMPSEVPMTTTERAYTSPIWYTP